MGGDTAEAGPLPFRPPGAGDRIRIGPGTAPHTYLQVRGARPLLAGPSLFLTGITPVDQVIEFAGLR
jgi:hypothetical protein